MKSSKRHREYNKEYTDLYSIMHREQVRERKRQWSENHPERVREYSLKSRNKEKERFHGVNLKFVFHAYYSQDISNYVSSIENYARIRLCKDYSLLLRIMYQLRHGTMTESEAIIAAGNHELTEEDKKYIEESLESWCKRSRIYNEYLNKKRQEENS